MRALIVSVPESNGAFAVWLTGLPASGKSTVAKALASGLRARGLTVEVLESDELRKVLTNRPRYDEEERSQFYEQIAYIGALLVKHGVAVIFDATANRRAYRDYARQQIPRFFEVYVDTPLEVCMARDPKGIYRDAPAKHGSQVPGLQVPYEPPLNPGLVIHGDQEPASVSVKRILESLAATRLISA